MTPTTILSFKRWRVRGDGISVGAESCKIVSIGALPIHCSNTCCRMYWFGTWDNAQRNGRTDGRHYHANSRAARAAVRSRVTWEGGGKLWRQVSGILCETSSDVTGFRCVFHWQDRLCACFHLHNAAVQRFSQCNIDARRVTRGYCRQGCKADRFCTKQDMPAWPGPHVTCNEGSVSSKCNGLLRS